MAFPTHILLVYGYLLLFAWVLVEQLGIPLPATPVLLAAGALSAQHELSFPLAFWPVWRLRSSADSTWFLFGRRYGHHVLRLLCKLSLEPTTCVRRTQDSFGRRRGVTLHDRQVRPRPGHAGPAGRRRRTAWASAAFCSSTPSAPRSGWARCWPPAASSATCSSAIPACSIGWAASPARCCVLGILGFFVGRVIRRRMVLKKLVAARLEPEELKRQLDAGEQVFIVDLRHPLELLPDPFTLPGALHFSPDALAARHIEIPRDRDIVLYCTCPSEATAAKTAMTLHKLGIERVRPLRGGFDEWKRLGFPLDAIAPAFCPVRAAGSDRLMEDA